MQELQVITSQPSHRQLRTKSGSSDFTEELLLKSSKSWTLKNSTANTAASAAIGTTDDIIRSSLATLPASSSASNLQYDLKNSHSATTLYEI